MTIHQWGTRKNFWKRIERSTDTFKELNRSRLRSERKRRQSRDKMAERIVRYLLIGHITTRGGVNDYASLIYNIKSHARRRTESRKRRGRYIKAATGPRPSLRSSFRLGLSSIPSSKSLFGRASRLRLSYYSRLVGEQPWILSIFFRLLLLILLPFFSLTFDSTRRTKRSPMSDIWGKNKKYKLC